MVKVKRIEQDKTYDAYASLVDNSTDASTGTSTGTSTGKVLNKAETAAYISDIVLQLRNLAKAADLQFLVYFLEMAFHEAFSQSTRERKSDEAE